MGTVNVAMNTQMMPEVIILPATKKAENLHKKKGKINAAAYCRVSTDQEEQLTSYEAQITYYTDKIQANPEWSLAGIFADEGITGVMTKNRDQFNEMIDLCRKGKIDLIITKSISRFARNLIDSIKYIREMKSIGVTIIFEKENINTSEMTSEMMVALYSVFAQAESESISNNVKMGKRFGYKSGQVPMMFGNIFGYRKGADGNAEIVPEEAEIIRRIYTKFLEGNSYSAIGRMLESEGIKTIKGNSKWSISVIQGILKNEKYKGDVLMQKTYVVDLFTKKSVKNTGELPMYLVKNHHAAIIEPEIFDRVQIEIARRNSLKSTSDKNISMRSKFSSKYALTGLVVCGECGSKYRRTTWSRKGVKKVVWRCISRLDHGTKYCKDSPTIDEDKLHTAIMSTINTMLDSREKLRTLLNGSIAEILSAPDTDKEIMAMLSKIDIKNSEMLEIIRQGVENREDREMIQEKCKKKHEEIAEIQQSLNSAKTKQQMEHSHTSQLREIYDTVSGISGNFTEYDDELARMAVSKVKIMSDTKAQITLFNSITIESELI